MNLTDKKTFWPYGILISFFLIISACAVTIILSLDYPVYMDNFYLEKYQNVDKKYNEIQISQKEFESRYDISFRPFETKVNEKFEIELTVMPKSKVFSNEIKGKILLTRPDSNKFNKEFEASFKNKTFTIPNIIVGMPGRWQVMARLDDGVFKGFYRFEFYAKEQDE